MVLSICVINMATVEGNTNHGCVSLNPRVPVVCKSPPTSSLSSLPPSIILQLNGGGSATQGFTATNEHDSDDELLVFAEESDVIVEFRGGSLTGKCHTRSQPLRISTYRKGIRQLKNSERREVRRQNRLKRLERKKLREEERENHLVYAKQLKVSYKSMIVLIVVFAIFHPGFIT